MTKSEVIVGLRRKHTVGDEKRGNCESKTTNKHKVRDEKRGNCWFKDDNTKCVTKSEVIAGLRRKHKVGDEKRCNCLSKTKTQSV